MRTDTIMVLHVTEDRDAAYFISIPRNTWTAVPGHEAQKINAGISLGGRSSTTTRSRSSPGYTSIPWR